MYNCLQNWKLQFWYRDRNTCNSEISAIKLHIGQQSTHVKSSYQNDLFIIPSVQSVTI